MARRCHQVATGFIKLDDSVIPVAIGHEERSIERLHHIGRSIESIGTSTWKSAGTEPQQYPAIGVDLGDGVP